MADAGTTHATPINLPLERSLYIGNILRGILYGLDIFTFFAAVYCISHRSSDYRKGQKLYVVYGGILLALVTVEVTLDALWGEYMWIDYRNSPGGPLGFWVASQNTWYTVTGWTAGIMTNILGDGLLVYRCYIIWGSQWYIIVLPALTYLASSVLAILTVVESAIPNTSLLRGKPILLAVPWVSLSVSLNVIVTSMICFRLLRMRALTRDMLSPEASRTYTSVAAMLIESAAPFSIIGIGLVITAAKNVPPTFAFAYVWSMFCSLSPQMIILRVAMGHGWLKETVKEINTAISFVPGASTTFREQSEGVGVTIYNTGSPLSGPDMPLDVSIRKNTSVADVVSLV